MVSSLVTWPDPAHPHTSTDSAPKVFDKVSECNSAGNVSRLALAQSTHAGNHIIESINRMGLSLAPQ